MSSPYFIYIWHCCDGVQVARERIECDRINWLSLSHNRAQIRCYYPVSYSRTFVLCQCMRMVWTHTDAFGQSNNLQSTHRILLHLSGINVCARRVVQYMPSNVSQSAPSWLLIESILRCTLILFDWMGEEIIIFFVQIRIWVIEAWSVNGK